MTRSRALALFVIATAAIAGCTSAGGSAAAGGAVSPVASLIAPIAAPSASDRAAPSPAASSATSGGGKGGYDYGGTTATPTAAGGSAAPGTVLLTGFAFAPTAVSVAAGSSLAFTNQDSVKHQLVEGENGTSVSASAPRSAVAPGQTVSIPFSTAGSLTITCTIHPSMNLRVTVTP